MGWRDWAADKVAEKRAAQPTFMDQMRGTGRVIRREGLAGGMSPLAIRRAAKEVRAERGFGAGQAGFGGDRNWTPPVHGMTRDGRPVTVSFGQGPKNVNETLICDGHVSMKTFYEKRRGGKGHDHYVADDSGADRGRYSD